MKPASSAIEASTAPRIQFSSRGLRNAPVKNTRNMCTVMPTTNSRAAQWWTWRMSRPPRTSKDSSRVEAYALDISTPFSGA